jgi:hypothetical protein
MRNHTRYIIFLLLATACKQTYMPPIVAHPPNNLVVEGFIETNGADPTSFTLSRTVKLDSNTYTPEPGATVTIEDTLQNKYPLTENTPGTYTYPAHQFNNNASYRLRITTTAGKEYASDFFPLVANPDIDSITWSRLQTSARNGMQIYANTHDPQNNARYFRFEYQETWEFHSAFEQTIKYIPGTGLVGNVPITDYICWHNNNSSDIVLASSVQLSQNLIFHAPIVFIPDGAQQLSVRYSILVKQYALTKEAFAWWQILQKNTEQIGSIFGVQPSVNPGNIHCTTDTAEQVLGYASGGNTHSQRIFITKEQAEPWDYSSGCVDAKIDPSAFQSAFNQGYVPWYQEPNGGSVHYSTNTCVDCTLTGTNIKPTFW